jgi:hypothetical protein
MSSTPGDDGRSKPSGRDSVRELSAESPPVRHRDIHGDWFDALERMGESFLFRMGRYRPGMSEPDWFFLPHQHFDGLGGFAHLLRTTQRTELALPDLAPRDRPSGPAKWMAALRLLCRRPVRPRPWQLPESGSNPSGEPTFAWTLFSAADTLALRAGARSRGVSLNAWLLWGLAESSLGHLAPGRKGAAWIVPINMRGAVPCRRATANLASILDVAFPLPARPSAVDAALRTEQTKLAHFGAWKLLQMVGHLPPWVRQAVVRHEAKVAKHGSFSNLGQLGPLNGTDPDVGEWWMAFNPVIRSRPVGMACLTWQGRMAATLQLHPVLNRSEKETRDWLSTWRNLVLPPCEVAPTAGQEPYPCDNDGVS